MVKLKQYLKKYSSRQLVESSVSSVNSMLEVIKIGDQLMLNSSNTNYSFGGLHRVFQKAFREIKPQENNLKDVLILGFGAGSVAAILQEELSIKCRITGVEKDPEVIRLGKDHFNTGRYADLELIEDDAAAFMNKETRLFDMIIIDVYVDFEVPESCESNEFVNDIYRCLARGGVILFNKLIYNHESGKERDELVKKFNSLDGSTRIIKTRENVVNNIIVFEK